MEGQIFTIFHFNDVYNIQPYTEQPKAGAAYFNSLLQREKKKYQHPLTLFSGDAFSPSLLSEEFSGENMIKPLRSFGIDLACIGNHDLDYELEQVKSLISKTNFPWLLSNIYDKRTNRRMADGLETYIIEKNGVKIGFFNLAEEEWLDTLYPDCKQVCQYIPFLQMAEKLVKKLRTEEKCDMIIALTHMMKLNDKKLAKQVKGIDLILGGHDHLILHEKVNQTVLVKSGTDFKHFSIIKVHKNVGQFKKQSNKKDTFFQGNSDWLFQIQLKTVNHTQEKIQPDPELNQYIEELFKQFKLKHQRTICFTKKPIDLRFKTIRAVPIPYLEFLASVFRHQAHADVTMMNSGNFRMDTYIEPGPITFGVISYMITDKVIVKLVPGEVFLEALEVSVSQYPNLAGRFSSFSGCQFTWDASKKPMERILKQTVKINGQPIEMKKIYKISCHHFMGSGGDGFECLKDCQTVERDGDKMNSQILHQLLHLNRHLLDTYIAKHPNRIKIIEYQGHKMLQFDFQEIKHIQMIMSTGQCYHQK